jgi:hypothetical protein
MKKFAVLLLALLVALSATALADYPDKQITVVCPYGAGGATDAGNGNGAYNAYGVYNAYVSQQQQQQDGSAYADPQQDYATRLAAWRQQQAYMMRQAYMQRQMMAMQQAAQEAQARQEAPVEPKEDASRTKIISKAPQKRKLVIRQGGPGGGFEQ